MDPDQKRLGELSPLTCPDCHGACTRSTTAASCASAATPATPSPRRRSGRQGKAWERALYDALRAQEEQAALVRRMAGDARRRGTARQADDFALRARS